MQTEEVTLYFTQGSSDKVYQVALEAHDGLYKVNFAYGRRGATLKTGTKTQAGVDYYKAKKIYDKLVNEKGAKGYVADEGGTKYMYSDDQVQTGIHCQLLNPIEEEEVQDFLEEDTWWAQEKMDGKRMLIRKAETVTVINRRGLSVGAPEPVMNAAEAIENHFLIDGEAIGDTLYVFDLLMWKGEDLQNKSYKERLALLEEAGFSGAIALVKTAKVAEDKAMLYKHLKNTDSEGIVFKNQEAIYTAGRPNSGGTQRKFKFYDTASVVVAKVNDKRSVAMMVYDGEKEIAIGNVTISINKDIPAEGSVIEVRYLYAFKGGSLYQPTFLDVRTDIEKQECKLAQLKYKKE